MFHIKFFLRIQGFLRQTSLSFCSFLFPGWLGVHTDTCAPTAKPSCRYVTAPPHVYSFHRGHDGEASLHFCVFSLCMQLQHCSCLFIHHWVSSFLLKLFSTEIMRPPPCRAVTLLTFNTSHIFSPSNEKSHSLSFYSYKGRGEDGGHFLITQQGIAGLMVIKLTKNFNHQANFSLKEKKKKCSLKTLAVQWVCVCYLFSSDL